MYQNLTFRTVSVLPEMDDDFSKEIFTLEEDKELQTGIVITCMVVGSEVFVLFSQLIDDIGNSKPVLPKDEEKAEAFVYLTEKLEDFIFEDKCEGIKDNYCICYEEGKYTDMTGEGHYAFEGGEYAFPNYINQL